MTVGNRHVIAFIAAVLIASSPFAPYFLPSKYAVHVLLDGCALAVVYFAGRGMSLIASALCLPLIFIGVRLPRDSSQRKEDLY